MDDRFTPTQVRFYGCRMRVGRGLLAVVSGSLLGLAACSGGGDDPVVLPSETTEPTTTPTVTDTTAASPPTREPTPTTSIVLPNEHVEEVDAFIRGFFEAYNAAQDSGDFATFDSTYLPQCVGCLEMRDELERWLAGGGLVEGADWIIQQQFSAPFLEDYEVLVVAFRSSGGVSSTSGNDSIEATASQLFTIDVRRGPPLIVYDLAMGPA